MHCILDLKSSCVHPAFLVSCMSRITGLFIKVADLCRFILKTGSDTFRNVLIYGKEQNSRRIFHNYTKKNSSSWEGLTVKTRVFRY